MRRFGLAVAALLAGMACPELSLVAQQIGSLDGFSRRAKSYVVFAAEAQSVKAGRRSVLELRFHVVDGFHVNSHTPRSELLIPAQVVLQPAAGVRAEAAVYPAGTSFSFSFDPKEKLDVYAGDFTVKVPIVAVAGAHTVDGALRYQACDHAACYPPKNLPVQVLFTAK